MTDYKVAPPVLLRVGSYRVVYEIDDTARTVDVSIVRHRRDVYRF